ncbi:phosphate ABC transporter permease PstA [Caldibacillus lycopersici]|uniref:Phosphate transport system permease protein PstA n=1 Tax=Perspicuibacillus lycopersici TaxID=1325689 RepID=A0AAE3LND2_9BACI|nr:phosphate ABC transporter permease PstA [Perspicuibacillus lycopersici]MCU9614575.1 phosphate ABC transporter permease PstA [Perspicuibacillus lycopersici]
MNRKIADRIATITFVGLSMIIVAILLYLFAYIIMNGFSKISWDFLTSPSSNILAGSGIRDQLFNSFYILILTLIISVPLGVLGGIYMAQYAKPGKLTNFIRSCIEMLSSLPSIVIGMFGLLVFVNTTGWGYTIFGGALTIAIFNIPVMVRTCEDAIRSVPRELKEASLALGITQWHTVKTVLLPSAFPGILTGVILSAGRIFGEAAALLYTAGLSTPRLDYTNWNPFADNSPLNIFRPAETLAVHIWSINTQGLIPDVTEKAAGASAVLVISVLIFNLLARWIGSMYYKKMTATK